jgi:hypothetical protein
MKYLNAFMLTCALFLMPAAAMGAAWKDGAYLQWYPNDDASLSIEPLQQFAIGFNPKIIRTGKGKDRSRSCPDSSGQHSSEVSHILRRRTIDNDYRVYVSLILIKIYSCQYEVYGMSEGFEDDPSELDKLNLVHGAYVKLLSQSSFSVEYPLAYNIVNYLKANPVLLKDIHIQKALSKYCRLAKKRQDTHNWSVCMKLLR